MAHKTTEKLGADEMLKQLASQSVQQAENLRETVREITLQALKTRELNLEQIKGVLRAVTEGVNLGAATPKVDTAKAISEAWHGMDEALLKAVQASHLALEQFMSQGKEFNDTHIKQALNDLGHLEEEFLNTVKQASEGATGKVKEQWGELLKHTKFAGTDAGHLATQTMEAFQNRMTGTLRETQEASLQAAQIFAQNFATLASGILIGMSEALQQKGQPKGKK